MKAIMTKQPGGAEQLHVTDVPKPEPREGELLINVKAAAINRTDILNREGRTGYMTNPILGIEVAGIVEEVGPNTEVKVGTRVMGLVNGGGYAEYAIMPAERAMIIPEGLSFEEAAAIPEVFLTAYQTLYWLGSLNKGETVLVHAGGSGVGTAAIQLAKQISSANVITTAGSKAKLDFAQSLGADYGINYKEKDFSEEVSHITDGQGVDLILDFVGASYWNKNLSSIKVDGRWVLIGILGGAQVEVNLMELMSKRVQLTGTLLTPRSDEYKAKLTVDFSQATIELFESKQLKPIVDSVFAFEDVQQAHRHMEENKNIGKIILKVDSSS
ncbi:MULTISPECIES: NAD(P)H-quinone oxidoreductase [Ornithinibacillus]|uniref:NAD(P)H-quinone oxidoreductase n=2 Tax=Ornithinibacillus TaxID=484508 RepID=A0A923L3D3_9BACI|nr:MULTISPECIES: NAD(P)H-quinone oxidoreductase [Ornithinibacillus]MBC5635739.1 NAD(P)H-quinone oxidoreductase [Ornithinibacillus hominis]MBS3679350.1 NAD(P)H-quinone oxidoreductase [Ornithinibacillus massiliensis]